MARIANKDARRQVDNRWEFKTNNETLFGIYHGTDEGRLIEHGVYAVYSYGKHFPIYAFIRGKWYGNKDRYSVTTSRHQSQARPSGLVAWLTTQEMKNAIHNGYVGAASSEPVNTGNGETLFAGEER